MKTIDAAGMDFAALNELLRDSEGDVELLGCLGQRFIGAGMGKRKLCIHGVPGNALGAYLNGADCIEEIRGDFVETQALCRPVDMEALKAEKWYTKLLGVLVKVLAPLI